MMVDICFEQIQNTRSLNGAGLIQRKVQTKTFKNSYNQTLNSSISLYKCHRRYEFHLVGLLSVLGFE